ncbi:transglycosylase SLT domain-containing protein [Salinarimonas soli]|uniref:Lytic transglycosylase domain-containing protein n=1 Tax=Salinarimonas soli TaxID=1638099 RepID=A0A5B2VFH4_9HYPH|nr:transglycosylase SLT domain-containing protein [Salinarimonas soli]KAA2237378.1 lytic transglycosylase domain-containing protein [Salinarimonas soli]
MRTISVVVATLAAISISSQASAKPKPEHNHFNAVCEAEMTRAAGEHGVPLGVLFAVALNESGRRGWLHPYALNVAGKSYFPGSPAEAMAKFAEERARGVKLIDLGCMQINHHYHGREFGSPQAMLDPGRNVDYAALFLKRLRAQHGSWTMAAARYHAGPNNAPAQKRYVCGVIRNLVASGFGEWTEGARSFCA